MNSTSPSWLSIFNTGSDVLGKSVSKACGHKRPSSEGPSTMPATISAMTIGCPSQRVTSPSARDTKRMAAICANNRAKVVNSKRRRHTIGASERPAASGCSPARRPAQIPPFRPSLV